jgi:hypothetical protein
MLDEATLAAIFTHKADKAKRRVKQGKGRVFVRTLEGLTSEVIERMGDYDFQQFEGKVGTMVRSRKGRTYHAPNGSRKFVVISSEVVAYKLK